MFALGVEVGLVGSVPVVKNLAENNTRTGFVNEADFQTILDRLPECLRPLAGAGYVTGWRLGSY